MKENQNEEQDNNNYEILSDDHPKFDLTCKIILIGDSSVGKSCLSVQATKSCFQTNHMLTLGFEILNFIVKLDEKAIRLQIWDTCGQEKYRSLIRTYYANSLLAIIMFAINE